MAAKRTLDEAIYRATQQQIMAFAGLVHDLPLEEFIETANHAQAIGPILDPTLWMKGTKKLDEVLRLANALRTFQIEVERQLGQALKEAGQ